MRRFMSQSVRAYVRVCYARKHACACICSCMRARCCHRRRRKAKCDENVASRRYREPRARGNRSDVDCPHDGTREMITLVPAVRLLPHRCLTRSPFRLFSHSPSSPRRLVRSLVRTFASSFLSPCVESTKQRDRSTDRPYVVAKDRRPARPRSVPHTSFFFCHSFEETSLDTRKIDATATDNSSTV